MGEIVNLLSLNELHTCTFCSTSVNATIRIKLNSFTYAYACPFHMGILIGELSKAAEPFYQTQITPPIEEERESLRRVRLKGDKLQ